MSFDLNMILGSIGSVVSIETRIREAIQQYKKYSNKRKIERIDLEIKFAKLKDMNEYSAEHIDEYITKHASSFKDINLSQVFSDTEKEKFIENFFEMNQDLIYYRDSISDILHKYITQLEKCISEFLTEGEKLIVKKVDRINDQIDNVNEEILDCSNVIKSMNSKVESIMDKVSNSNVYRDSNYSELIIGLLNMIFSEIENNTGEKLLKRNLQPNALKAENFEDFILKIQKMISLINKERMENIIKKNFDDGLCALHFYLEYIAADFVNKVNVLFSERIQLIIDCIYFHDVKDSKYYLALGAMGLRNNHTEENIYSYVTENLIEYFTLLLDVLKEKWKNRDYETLDDIAVEEMQKRLWYQIRCSITENNKQWIIEIIKNDKITDVQLAKIFNVSVKYLRKELYSATKTFLNHEYIDDNTTSLIIYGDYKKVIINKLSIEV